VTGISRNFFGTCLTGKGGGNVDDRQLIAQLVSVAGRWWLPWCPRGSVQRTPSQSSLVHKSK
jgi:hypothetical protein